MQPRLQTSESGEPRKRNVLAYAGRPIPTSERRSIPLGITSLASGILAAGTSLAITSIDIVSYLHDPVWFTDTVAMWLAILSGIIAMCLPGERVRGVPGLCFGLLSGLLMAVVFGK